MKRTESQIIVLALEYAILWEESYLDVIANTDMKEAINRTKQRIADFRRLQNELSKRNRQTTKTKSS